MAQAAPQGLSAKVSACSTNLRRPLPLPQPAPLNRPHVAACQTKAGGGILAAMSDSPYRQPILALILRVFGLLAAVVATLAFGAIVASLASGNGTAGVLVALPVLISALVSALLMFGVAQVIDYLGRTAHASEEAAESAKNSADLLRQLLRSYGHAPEV
jgi:hypothetical protein